MIDFKQVLQNRHVEPNSTWLRSNNSELIIVLPDDESAVRELCNMYACQYTPNPNADNPQWIRVIRVGLTSGKTTGVDIYYVPFMCGQIDKGDLKRVG